MRLLLPCKRHRIIIQLFGERLPGNSLRASGRSIGHSQSNWICIQNSVDRKYCVYLSESLPSVIHWSKKKKIEEEKKVKTKILFLPVLAILTKAQTTIEKHKRERTKNFFLDHCAPVRTLIMENLMQLISNFLPELRTLFFLISILYFIYKLDI